MDVNMEGVRLVTWSIKVAISSEIVHTSTYTSKRIQLGMHAVRRLRRAGSVLYMQRTTFENAASAMCRLLS